MKIEAGYLREARQVLSPNQDARPVACPPELLVLHSISLPPGEYGGVAIEHLFCNRLNPNAHPYYRDIANLKVSAHLLIRRCGELIQFVNFDARAWHAGQSCYQGRERCNDFSIGIELEGTDTDAFAAVQYRQLTGVCLALLDYYPQMSLAKITGHEHIAPGRKTDPGVGFNWPAFFAQLKAAQ